MGTYKRSYMKAIGTFLDRLDRNGVAHGVDMIDSLIEHFPGSSDCADTILRELVEEGEIEPRSFEPTHSQRAFLRLMYGKRIPPKFLPGICKCWTFTRKDLF